MPIPPSPSSRRAHPRRLQVAAALVILLGLAGIGPQAMAVNFDTSSHQAHQDWQTLIATLGDESHVRAVQRTSYSDAMLSVNATPGHCRTPWIEVRSDHRKTCRMLERTSFVSACFPTLISNGVLTSDRLGSFSAVSIKLRPWSLSRSGQLPKSARGPVSPSWMRSKRSSHNPRNQQ